MHTVERLVSGAARAVWPIVEKLQDRYSGTPKHHAWAPAPAQGKKKSKPPLGWPRETDSLCPQCVKEVREDILSGRRELRELTQGRPGEVKALIHERDGKIVMTKTCAKHGETDD